MIDGSIQDFPLTLDAIVDHAAKWHPNSQVVTAGADGGIVRIGYANLADRARRVSQVLAQLGAAKGQRVATLAWNSQDHVEAWYAIMGMGAVCHTLNPRLTAEQLAWMIAQSGATILVVSADLFDLAERIIEEGAGLRHVLTIDGDVPQTTVGSAHVAQLSPLLEAEDGQFAWGDFPETSPSGLCFTSGSTGAPKGVTYTHRSGFLHTLRLLQVDTLALSHTDAVLPVVPMFHANAWGLPFAVPACGATLVLPGRKTDGASLARLIAAENVTIAVGVPTVWLGLADHLAETGERLPSLKRIVSGGAPLPPALKDRLERELDVVVQTTWGMTELSPVGTVAPLDAADLGAGISGRPALGIDMIVADENGTPLDQQRNTEGRLFVRGSAVVERYFGQEHSATDPDGWFDTGDLARIDNDGNLSITGRSKDLIKSGGEWINPAEIEAVISALPQVALSAVIARHHERWGERPLLLVEMREGQDLPDENMLASLRGKVASWWIPEEVLRLERMPLAATGKIDKIRLRQMHSDPVKTGTQHPVS